MSGKLFEDRNRLLPSNYLSNDKERKTESEPKNTTSVTSPRPQLKKRNPKQITKKKLVGDQIAFLQIPKERGREQATAAEDITKNTKTTDQKT